MEGQTEWLKYVESLSWWQVGLGLLLAASLCVALLVLTRPAPIRRDDPGPLDPNAKGMEGGGGGDGGGGEGDGGA